MVHSHLGPALPSPGWARGEGYSLPALPVAAYSAPWSFCMCVWRKMEGLRMRIVSQASTPAERDFPPLGSQLHDPLDPHHPCPSRD